MIAYLFWHRPGSSADPLEYERGLAGFHERLRVEPPLGFRRSATFRTAAPWFGDGYEDWYLVDDWTSLGVLNAAAVDAAHRPEHDAVAADTVKAAGGVYELRHGDLEIGEAGAVDWYEKPAGLPYREMEADLIADRVAADLALWQRQLVLGPAPEYCLLTRGDELQRVAGG